MATTYFDPATGEWVTRGELARRRHDGPAPAEVWPAWLEAKEPQEVEVVESTPYLDLIGARKVQIEVNRRAEARLDNISRPASAGKEGMKRWEEAMKNARQPTLRELLEAKTVYRSAFIDIFTSDEPPKKNLWRKIRSWWWEFRMRKRKVAPGMYRSAPVVTLEPEIYDHEGPSGAPPPAPRPS